MAGPVSMTPGLLEGGFLSAGSPPTPSGSVFSPISLKLYFHVVIPWVASGLPLGTLAMITLGTTTWYPLSALDHILG